jgi:hypothetical protein
VASCALMRCSLSSKLSRLTMEQSTFGSFGTWRDARRCESGGQG